MHASSLLIVNYNTEAYICETIANLVAQNDLLPQEVLVVDNSPENGLKAALATMPLAIAYHPTSRNLGFAGAVNFGQSLSTGSILILLNPDAHPLPGCLPGLVSILRRHRDIGIAGPKLLPLAAGAPLVPSATRTDPSLLSVLIEYGVLHRLVGKNWLEKHYFVSPAQQGQVDCAMVQGACLALHRDWWDAVGGFDADRFFLYFEETDFCRRVRAKGGRVVYCPQLACRHMGGVSMPDQEQDVSQFWRSLYAYHRKHHGLLRTAILRLLLIPSMAAELGLLITVSRRRHPGDPALERYIQHVRRRLAQQFRLHSTQGDAP